MNVVIRFHETKEIGTDLMKHRYSARAYETFGDYKKWAEFMKKLDRDENAELLKGFVRTNVRECGGVYFLMKNGVVIYIGRSNELRSRLMNHADKGGHLHQADAVAFHYEEEIPMQNVYEAVGIATFMPELNKLGKVV